MHPRVPVRPALEIAPQRRAGAAAERGRPALRRLGGETGQQLPVQRGPFLLAQVGVELLAVLKLRLQSRSR